MKIIRTEKEINKKIKDLLKNPDNYTYDNYGSESAENGIYEISFSKDSTDKTLRDFVDWLVKK